MSKDNRWKQRFEKYSEAFAELEKSLLIAHPDFAQQAGIVKLFELSFELAWKVQKDYLDGQGYLEIRTPRTVIQTSVQSGILEENEAYEWLDALESRNALTHTYSEELAKEEQNKIRNTFYPILKIFTDTWKQKL